MLTVLNLQPHQAELVDGVEEEVDGALGDLRRPVQFPQQHTLAGVQVVPVTETYRRIQVCGPDNRVREIGISFVLQYLVRIASRMSKIEPELTTINPGKLVQERALRSPWRPFRSG